MVGRLGGQAETAAVPSNQELYRTSSNGDLFWRISG